MNERAVSEVLVPLLRSENPEPDTFIACQRDICWREGRVDVLVVNGSLTGFEIKSDRDSLTRLPRQMDLYGRVLDYATVVCAPRHLDAANRLLPEWWGLREVAPGEEGPAIRKIRAAAPNPGVRAEELARLLSRDEVYAELAYVRGVRGVSGERQAQLAERLVEATDLDELRRIVRDRLRQRPSWRAAASRT